MKQMMIYKLPLIISHKRAKSTNFFVYQFDLSGVHKTRKNCTLNFFCIKPQSLETWQNLFYLNHPSLVADQNYRLSDFSGDNIFWEDKMWYLGLFSQHILVLLGSGGCVKFSSIWPKNSPSLLGRTWNIKYACKLQRSGMRWP